MTGLDWVIGAVVLLSVVLAAAKGLFYEVFVLAGAVLGYLLAVWEYWRVAAWAMPYVRQPWVADLIGYLTVFFLVLLLAGFAGSVARWVAGKAGLGAMDRLLGGAFGLVRGVIVVAVLLLAMASFAPDSRLLRDSRLAGYFLIGARVMSWVAPTSLRQRFRSGMEHMRSNPPPAANRPSSGTADRQP